MSDSQAILTDVLALGRDLPSGELPGFLGKLEEIRVVALTRLTTPVPVAAKQADELLTAKEAARRLGVSVSYLYHHDFPFTLRDPEVSRLRFSAAGIQRYIEQQTNNHK